MPSPNALNSKVCGISLVCGQLIAELVEIAHEFNKISVVLIPTWYFCPPAKGWPQFVGPHDLAVQALCIGESEHVDI